MFKSLLSQKLPILLILLLALYSFAGCSTNSNLTNAVSTPAEVIVQTDTSSASDASWDASATQVTFSGENIEIEGGGASATDHILTISKAGTYVLNGTLTDGQIRVDADKEDTVQLILNGVTLSASENSVIYGVQSDKIILSLVEGTTNTIVDGEIYSANSDDDPDAAVYSDDDLEINGTGQLIVMANYHNGITSKDDLIIAGGQIEVNAVNDTFRGRDSLTVTGGTIELIAGGDGLQSNNDEDSDKGWIAINGGTLQINAEDDGLQAETTLNISSGEITLATADDGLHAGTDLTITDGILEISAVDDAIHAENALNIQGGNINITSSYEGLEGTNVTISGGLINVQSSDDGINAAGEANVFIRISGGNINVNANGDGIDANGDLYFEGGAVYVNGPTNNGNGAMDYDGECLVTGGTLAIAGSSGMAQAPGEESSQNSIIITFTETQAPGTTVALTDSDGQEVISFTPAKTFQSLVFSSPALEEGAAYTLTSSQVNDDQATVTLSEATITLSGTLTSIAEDGTEVEYRGGMMGGGHGPRGDRPQGERPQGEFPGDEPPQGEFPQGDLPETISE